MKRFLSLALLALFCLFSNVARADVAIGDIIHDDTGVAYEVTSLNPAEVRLAKQQDNDGVTEGEMYIPYTFVYDGETYTVTALTIVNGSSTTTVLGSKLSITSLEFGEGFTTIDAYAILSISTLTSITLPSTITSLGSGAIRLCSNLATITCKATTPPTLGSGSTSFISCSALKTIYVPEGCVDAYNSEWGSNSYISQYGVSFAEIGTEDSGDDNGDGEEVATYGESLGTLSVGTSQADKATNSFDNTTYGASYYVTYTPDSNGTLYLSDSEILCYEDANSTEVTGTWESNGVNASAHTLTAGTTYYIVFSGGGVFGVSFYAWFEADESSDVEVSSSYGESLGEMKVGTEDSHASYTNMSLSTNTNYYMTYTPDADGTLSIICSNDVVVYADAEGQDEVTGTWEGTTVSYTLTGGTTYYVVFTSGMLEGTVAYSGAWYVESVVVDVEFSIVSITAADGTDLTSNITTEGKLDLAVLEDGMQMVINCTNASGYYLDIVFGTVGTEQYLTQTSDRLTADEDGNFTWTGGWDYELTEGYVYPVVCELYDAEHNGNLLTSATVLTLVGTSPNKVSDVTLVSSDPSTSEEIEVEEGKDLTITLTFSDYVMITAEIPQTFGVGGDSVDPSYQGNFKSLDATGVEGTGDGNGYYTQWTFTIPASELADENYGGEITVSISGTDSNGLLLYDASGYNTYTYSYTIISKAVVSVTFDPESDTTVESLKTITVTGVVEGGECTSLLYVSDESDFVIYKDDVATDYELYVNDDATPEAGQLIFNIADTSDPYNEDWEAEITEAGVYTIVIPGNTFQVNNTVYDEPVTLTYTIESTEPITLTFDPASGSTVTELGAITVSSEQGAVTYISYDSDFAVSVNGEESDDYIAWYDEDQDADGAIVMVVNDGSWTATEGIITDAGEYSITFPAGTFAVAGTSYDEDVTLTYTIESTSNEGGEGEGDENGGTETGISAIQAAIADGAEVYTISGQKVTAPVNGVNIVKYADGSVKKILQK